jgi:hypothetical protein
MSKFKVKMSVRFGLVIILGVAGLGCGTSAILVRDDATAGGSGGGGSGGMGGGGQGGGPACPGECVPLGSLDWIGPGLLWIGKEGEAPECPPSAPVASTFVYADLNAPNLCGACKCDVPSGTCTLPGSLTAAGATCAGDGPGAAHTSFNSPAGWSGACTSASPIPAGQKCNGVNCVQSLTIGPLTLTETSCGVSTEPVASKLPFTWGTTARTCHGTAFGPCASPSEVCAPPVEPGFEQCLVQTGDKECPDLYTVKHVFYHGLEDTRDCTPCACSAPVGGSCSASISVFKDASCTSPVFESYGVDSSGPKCLDVPPGVALGSKLATEPVYAPGVCQVSGGDAIGQAAPVEPSTFCCLPSAT